MKKDWNYSSEIDMEKDSQDQNFKKINTPKTFSHLKKTYIYSLPGLKI